LLYLYHYDIANTLLGQPGGTQVVLAPNTWTRISNTVTFPAGTDHVVMAAYTINGTGFTRWVTGDTFDITGLMLESVGSVGSYFDGSTQSSGDGTMYAWVGTANATESYQYKADNYELRRNKIVDPRIANGSGWLGVTATGTVGAASISGSQVYSPNVFPVFIGDVWTASIDLTAPPGQALTGQLCAGMTTAAAFGSNTRYPVAFNIPAGQTQRIYASVTIAPGADGVRLLIQNINIFDGTPKLDKGLLEKTGQNKAYFDGYTNSGVSGADSSWVGAPNSTESIVTVYGGFPNESRRNTFQNPNLELNNNFWTFVNQGGFTNTVTREFVSPPPVPNITKYLKMTVNTVTTGAFPSTGWVCGNPSVTQMRVVGGKDTTFSIWWRCSVPDRQAYLVCTFHDAFGTQVGSMSSPTYYLSNGAWVRTVLTVTAATSIPANAVRAYVRLYSASGRAWQVGDTMEATAFACEPGVSSSPNYWDGNTPNDSPTAYQWTGAVSASESVILNMNQNNSASDGWMNDLINAGYTTGSLTDRIMKQLSDMGYSTGSIADREYARLKAKTGKTTGSIMDLYALAGERPRLAAFRR
jgi:hypothetical protein